MMDSGGEGGLGVSVEMKQFRKFSFELDKKKDAEAIVEAMIFYRNAQRKTLPILPELDTMISELPNEKWAVWYRDRI